MKTDTSTEAQPGTDTLGTILKEHVLAQLRQAEEIAISDLPARTDRFRELLEEVVARTEACELAQMGDDTADDTPPTSRVRCAVLAAARGEPVTEFLLIPFGEVQVDRPVAGDSFVFARRHAESATRWFDQTGRRLAIDYEHQSFDRYNTRADGLRPAAGWIGRLEIRDDGLWAADVRWTKRARELLTSGEYKYFSPVIYWTDENYTDVAALGPVALTNDPAMRGVPPLAASRRPTSTGDREKHTDVQPGAPNTAMSADADQEWVPRADLETAEAEVTVLRNQLAAQEADTFVERGMRLGKILDSTSMDWREDYLRDPERTEERLARAPVLLPPGRIVRAEANGELGLVAGAHAEFRRHAAIYGRWGIEPEDLVAYERALAADRVRHFGALK